MRVRHVFPSRRLFLLLLAFAIFFDLGGAGACRAQTSIAWEPPEVVDTRMTALSSTASECAVFLGGSWHLVYGRDGQIFRKMRSAEGWSAVEEVSTVPGAAANPHAELYGEQIVVVWEDDRTGTVEIWSRIWAAGAWSAESCLTPGAAASLAPALARYEDGGVVLLVWQEGTSDSQIFCRRYYGTWSASQQVSQSSGSATEPTAGGTGYSPDPVVVWTDDRLGTPRLFARVGQSPWWGPETELATPAGESRHPSLCSGARGGDVWAWYPILVFEHTAPGGVPEVWTTCGDGLAQVRRVSPDDGVPSVSPSAASFSMNHFTCFFWASLSVTPVITWTDLDGGRTHRVSAPPSCPAATDPSDSIAGSGITWAVTAAAPGTPRARLLSLWLEEGPDGPMLMARSGSMPGCEFYDVFDAPPLVLVPGAGHPTPLQVGGECDGVPLPDFPVQLEFSPQVESNLTWDPAQTHPVLHGVTDDQGWVTFTLRGGGCAPSGWVHLNCDDAWGNGIESWWGARSPDLNGDCTVGRDDIEAIEARLGTSDFCADFNGNGLVDSSDVAFARSVAGVRCTDPAGLDPGQSSDEPSMHVWPNPCRERVVLQVRGGVAWESVRVLDIQGRLVRSWTPDPRPVSATGPAPRLEWDLRDRESRPVPSGVYWILTRAAGRELRESVLVTR